MTRLDTDVAIIGGGIVGCSAALWLRRHMLSVALVEKGAVGSQASGVNFGGVRRQGRELAELPLAMRAHRMWRGLGELVGSDCEFVPSGHLKLARSEADLAELEAYAATAAAYGLRLEVIGRRQLAAEYPWLGPGVLGASLSPEDGHANPRLAAPAFARAARAAGADIREFTRVVEAGRAGDRFRLLCADNRELASRFLVNAAGAWAGDIARCFGEPAPVGVSAPTMLVTEPLPRFVTRSIGICGGGLYLRQVARGNVVFGGGASWADLGSERSRPLPVSSLSAMERACGIVPGLGTALVIRSWTGIEGEMPDKLPVIGFSATTPNLIHAFGFSGHGFQLGPGVGAVIDELVRTGGSASPIAAFDIRRFAGAATGAASGVRRERFGGESPSIEREMRE